MWAFRAIDGEVDDCDREDCDPDEAQQQPPEEGRSMMDHSDAAHAIYMMVKVLVELKKACRCADSDTSVFQVLRADGEMISSASIDIHKCVKALQLAPSKNVADRDSIQTRRSSWRPTLH